LLVETALSRGVHEHRGEEDDRGVEVEHRSHNRDEAEQRQ